MAGISVKRSWSAWWDETFFSEEAPYGLALMRMLLPGPLLVDAIYRWPIVRELYSSDGAPSPLGDNFGVPDFLPIPSGPVAVALHTAMIFFLITTSIGWRTRLSIVGAGFLTFYFGYLDIVSTITKYTVICIHFFLLLSLSECGSIWSVDAWLKRPARGSLPGVSIPPRFAVWPQKLIHILLMMVYVGAAVTKMHTPTFFSGDQLMYWMMTYMNNRHPVGDYLSQFPLVVMIFGYIAILWELAFPFTIWQKWGRWPTLAIGALFHLMTAATLGLYIFPVIMISSYFAFLTEADIVALRRLLRDRRWWTVTASTVSGWVGRVSTLRPRTQWAATGAFAVLLTLTMLGGVQAEQMLDVYQMNGPNGPLPLKELPPEEVARLMEPAAPLREVDKFLAVDVGTVSVGEHLLDRRSVFRLGQTAIVQVSMNPPHEDMWVECLLKDLDGAILSRAGQIVARENFRAQFVYKLDGTYEPGPYTFVIRSSNQEVMKKEITLAP
jgi:hypothetical protein